MEIHLAFCWKWPTSTILAVSYDRKRQKNGWSAVSKLTYGSFTNGVTLCYPKSSLKEFSISHKHFGINPFMKGPSCWTLPFWCPIFLEHPIWKQRFSLPLPPAVASPSASNFCRGTWKVYHQNPTNMRRSLWFPCGFHPTKTHLKTHQILRFDLYPT